MSGEQSMDPSTEDSGATKLRFYIRVRSIQADVVRQSGHRKYRKAECAGCPITWVRWQPHLGHRGRVRRSTVMPYLVTVDEAAVLSV